MSIERRLAVLERESEAQDPHRPWSREDLNRLPDSFFTDEWEPAVRRVAEALGVEKLDWEHLATANEQPCAPLIAAIAKGRALIER
jgi:hypothetical protein